MTPCNQKGRGANNICLFFYAYAWMLITRCHDANKIMNLSVTARSNVAVTRCHKRNTKRQKGKKMAWSTIAAWETEAARLVAARRALRWSIDQAAAAIGCHHNTLARWERLEHAPGVDSWLSWRRALGFDSPWPIDEQHDDMRVAFRDAIMNRAQKD